MSPFPENLIKVIEDEDLIPREALEVIWGACPNTETFRYLVDELYVELSKAAVDPSSLRYFHIDKVTGRLNSSSLAKAK